MIRKSQPVKKNGATRSATASRRIGSVGLLAAGSSGPWEIAIDQTVSGRDRWFAQIEGPSIDLYFEVESLQIVQDAIRFLERGRSHRGRKGPQKNGDRGELTLGSNKTVRVQLLQDDEFADRVFLVMEQNDRVLARLTIHGSDLEHVRDALRQVTEDL